MSVFLNYIFFSSNVYIILPWAPEIQVVYVSKLTSNEDYAVKKS